MPYKDIEKERECYRQYYLHNREKCIEQSKQYYLHHREKRLEQQTQSSKQLYMEYKNKGRCTKCGKIVTDGYILCAWCAYKSMIRCRKWYQKNVEHKREWWRIESEKRHLENRCMQCGTPLWEGESRYCFACRANWSQPLKREVLIR